MFIILDTYIKLVLMNIIKFLKMNVGRLLDKYVYYKFAHCCEILMFINNNVNSNGCYFH